MPKKISILFIDEIPLIAGGANSLLQLVKMLDNKGYEKYLACPPGPLAEAAKAVGVRHIPFVFRFRYLSIRLFRLKVLLNPFSLILRLLDAIRLRIKTASLTIDIVHTNNLDSHITGWFLKKLFGMTVIWHIRVIWPRALYAIPWPDHIIFVSDAVKQAALGKLHTEKPCSVIYNGIDLRDFSPGPSSRASLQEEFKISANEHVIASVGRLLPQKGFDTVLRAIDILNKSSGAPVLLIVGSEIENRRKGSESHTEYLKKQVKELGLEQKVILTGHRNDVRRILNGIDLFVAGYVNDSNPRSVLEAMALAKPVIGTKSGGIPTMLDNGRVGVLVSPGDPNELASAIKSLLLDEKLRLTLGRKARQRVVENYTLLHHVRQIENLYGEILENTPEGIHED